MAPIAGGFVAGLIGRTNPPQAGLLAGLGGAFVILFSWLGIAGLSLETTLSGLVIGLLWVFLSRLGAGFSSAKNHRVRGKENSSISKILTIFQYPCCKMPVSKMWQACSSNSPFLLKQPSQYDAGRAVH